ncbi:hypothetical protein D3C78_850480 [compost metagenome]
MVIGNFECQCLGCVGDDNRSKGQSVGKVFAGGTYPVQGNAVTDLKGSRHFDFQVLVGDTTQVDLRHGGTVAVRIKNNRGTRILVMIRLSGFARQVDVDPGISRPLRLVAYLIFDVVVNGHTVAVACTAYRRFIHFQDNWLANLATGYHMLGRQFFAPKQIDPIMGFHP